MTISAVYQNERCIVRIDGAFTIYEAGDAKHHLLGDLNLAPELEVDLAGVTEIDTAGIQLLLLLKREAAQQEKPLHFHGHSKAVLALIDLYNMAGIFGDPVVLEGKGGA
ncbi:lipid asymmetry maintenance protein MlaB [Chitinimonas sp.]|uniref:STAS domain-containing protein n=1 Tax=Chitinimonas sp. TaxID=1934313 RepID=UPI0035B04BAA